VSLTPESRKTMGEQAMRSVERYSTANFTEGWRRIYAAGGMQ